jgi:hypothetical protein
METRQVSEGRTGFLYEHQTQWGPAFLAGILAGVIFLIVNHGLPWFTSGLVSPSLMGREIIPRGEWNPGMGLGVALLHMTFAVVYGLIIAPVVGRFSFAPAMLAGAGLGLVLYLFNFIFFKIAFPAYAGGGELAPIVTHLAFGVVAAGAYKGLGRKGIETG